MKITYILLMAAITVNSACKKTNDADPSPLTGTWKLNAYYISPGGPGSWIAAPGNDKSYMQFFSSGLFKSNIFNSYQVYTFKENEFTIQSNSEVALGYSYYIKHDTLTINQSKPAVCTDGCAIRFIRQK